MSDETYSFTIFFTDGNTRYEWGTAGTITRWAARYGVTVVFTEGIPRVTRAPLSAESVAYQHGDTTLTWPLAINLGTVRTTTVEWTE